MQKVGEGSKLFQLVNQGEISSRNQPYENGRGGETLGSEHRHPFLNYVLGTGDAEMAEHGFYPGGDSV